jgi:hypothetical protein
MSEIEISKPVGIAAAVLTTLLVAVGIWFAAGRQQGDATKPSMTGVPAVAGPAAVPPDAAGVAPTGGPGGAAMPMTPIPR